MLPTPTTSPTDAPAEHAGIVAPVPADWLARYLRLIGVEAEPPSLAALSRLARAHLLAVPFENISSLLRCQAAGGAGAPFPDPDAQLRRWENREGGGVCFDVAAMVDRLLSGLGYQTWPVVAGVRTPNDHQANVVVLDGARYLVDLGNGAPFFEPIPLDRVAEVHFGALTYRFTPSEDGTELAQDRLIGGNWAPFCRYRLTPARLEDRLAGFCRHLTPGLSWVVGDMVLGGGTEDTYYAARDGKLTVFTRAGEKRDLSIQTAEEFEQLARTLGLPNLAVRQALAYKTELTGS